MTDRSIVTSEALVRKFEGFGLLTEADRVALCSLRAETHHIPAGSDLLREGETPTDVVLILEGFACRYKLQTNGTRGIIAYLVPGDFCDLDVVPHSRMDHSVGTLSACRVAKTAPETIRMLLQRPALAHARRLTTLADEGTAREWLINVGRRAAVERVAHLFCELHARLQVVGLVERDSFELPVTHADLADTTGLSPVHVCRSLQQLRQRGLIEFKSRRLTILDLPRLQLLADFRPNYLHLESRAAA